MKRGILLLASAIALLGLVEPTHASPSVRYGLQDDAWLLYGPGSLDQRVQTLDAMGVQIVRFTLDWSKVERKKGVRDWGMPTRCWTRSGATGSLRS